MRTPTRGRPPTAGSAEALTPWMRDTQVGNQE
jgi:hypothetical protein